MENYMKNILLGPVFILVFLPQMSFGAPVDPRVAACNQQMDAAGTAFYGQQGIDRDAFKKLHPDLIAKHDLRYKQMLAYRIAQQKGDWTVPPAPDEDAAMAAFIQKQESDKEAFLANLYAQRNKCLGL